MIKSINQSFQIMIRKKALQYHYMLSTESVRNIESVYPLN